jgi:hypothetical protein
MTWTDDVKCVETELISGMKLQALQYPGFSFDTTTDRKLFAVHGILDVHELAVRVVKEQWMQEDSE